MTAPFMRSYTELLVQTCHHREAHAIGGMAAYIPSRRDPEVNREVFADVALSTPLKDFLTTTAYDYLN
jgi:malate synthase